MDWGLNLQMISAVPCRAVPCRAVPCRAVPCRAVPCRAVPCRAVPCRAVPCRAVPCRAVPCRACHNSVYSIIVLHKIINTEHVHVNHNIVSFRYSYVVQWTCLWGKEPPGASCPTQEGVLPPGPRNGARGPSEQYFYLTITIIIVVKCHKWFGII